jgi:hypothetical protein
MWLHTSLLLLLASAYGAKNQRMRICAGCRTLAGIFWLRQAPNASCLLHRLDRFDASLPAPFLDPSKSSGFMILLLMTFAAFNTRLYIRIQEC